MSPFYIVLTIVAIRSVNIAYARSSEHPYIVSIYNKHTGTSKGYQICAGSLITNSHVLTTRFCLPRHAYKIRYGNMKTVDGATYSRILHRKYHINSRPEVIHNHLTNVKQVVSGSNNIAMALVEKIPDIQIGRVAAIDYRTIIGLEVQLCTFDVNLPTSKTRHVKETNLKTIFFKKKKRLQEYFLYINQNHTRLRPEIRQRLKLTDKYDLNHVINNAIKFIPGVVAACQEKTNAGPYICVVEKCMNVGSNIRMLLTPDFGTPLLYDGKIIALATDVNEHFLKYTPVSPFLNWIHDYVKIKITSKTNVSEKRKPW